jgi:hypothetical protein
MKGTQTEPVLQEAAMMRSGRGSRVVWSQSSGVSCAPQPRPSRARRARRLLRIGVLLTILRLTPAARAVFGRWRILLPATVLTVAGVLMRSGSGSIVLLPGLIMFLAAPLTTPRSRRGLPSELERELGSYSTPPQRRDLEAILDRYPDEVTIKLRNILANQRLARR